MKLKGTVTKIIYRNEDNGFSVLKLKKRIATGYLPGLFPGEEVLLNGKWARNTYGKQFKTAGFTSKLPKTEDNIIRFLSHFRGIGEVLAGQIVDEFNGQIFKVIDNDLQSLSKIKGIGSSTLENIQKAWERRKQIQALCQYMSKHRGPLKYVTEIYNIFDGNPVKELAKNPYALVPHIKGISFKSADKIAQVNRPEERNKAALRCALHNKGDVYQAKGELIKKAKEIAGNNIPNNTLNKLEEVVIKNNRVYQADLYHAERNIESLVQAHFKEICLEEADIDPTYTDEQARAIEMATQYNGLILTGGAGTGKTYAIKGIVDAYQDKKVKVTATTGKAASNITNSIGIKAGTIHRLLGFDPDGNYNNKLDLDLLVIDEASMIDTLLMEAILEAITPKTTLVLSGDPNQLPSVKPGNVLKDMMGSPFIVVKLTHIQRQDAGSDIVVKANQILQGQIPTFENRSQNRVLFIESTSIKNKVADLVSNKIPDKFNRDPLGEVQVLTPFNEGVAGVGELNHVLQKQLIQNRYSLNHAGRSFHIGDKVMQLENDYDREVFNGEVGYVENINSRLRLLSIAFGYKSVDYKLNELNQIDLAYACTVHKSQGHSYPIVIMAIPNRRSTILNRHLIYTALTRAEQLFMFVGSHPALSDAVNQVSSDRQSSLFDSQ